MCVGETAYLLQCAVQKAACGGAGVRGGSGRSAACALRQRESGAQSVRARSGRRQRTARRDLR